MDSFKGYLYVLNHKYFNYGQERVLCKIGSTKDIASRLATYKTGYPDIDSTNCEFMSIQIISGKYNCYYLDDIINYSSEKNSNPYRHYNGTGGIEFYYYDGMEKLTKFLDELGITYEIKIHKLEDIKSENINYESIGKEETEKIKRRTPLRKIEIDKILSEINLSTITFRPKQEETFKNAVKQFESTGNIFGIIYGPPGCGKTIIAISIANYLLNKMPLGYIIWATKYQNVLDSQFTDKNIRLWVQSNILSGDISIIKRYEKPNKFKKTIICCCTNTLRNNEDLLKDNLIGIIYDECHNLGTKSYEKLLQIKKVPPQPTIPLMLGMSATPRENTSFYNLFGENNKINYLLDYSFVDAIADGSILPIDINYKFVDAVNINGLNTFSSIVNPDKCYPYLKDILKNSYNGKAIFWANSDDSADKWYEFLKPLLKKDGFETYIDHSKIKNDSFHEFNEAKTYSVMIAVHKFREGTDIPNVSVCGFLDPVNDRSIVTLLQSMGRCVRKFKDKHNGIYFEFLFRNNESAMNERITQYYYSATHILNAKQEVGELEMENSGEHVVIKKNNKVINIIKVSDDFGIFNYVGLTAKIYSILLSKIKGLPSWKEIQELLSNKNIKDKDSAIEYLSKNLSEWWEIMRYRIIDWDDLLTCDISDYYSIEECKEKIKYYINKLYEELTFEDVKDLTSYDIYKKYILCKDNRLPVNLLNYCKTNNISELIDINKRYFNFH